MKKYAVIDERASGTDTFETFFDSADEANASAQVQWDHLTNSERKFRHIYAAVIGESNLNEDAVDEDGNIDWGCRWGHSTFSGAFDSAKAFED